MDKKSRELVMAKLYFKNKDYKLAEKSFNEYLNMSPNDVTALKLLAQVYEQNKRFDKAYEMYERCYLAEPERTGVLLDICRILLMNEIWLEHVDYRRWLNLAVKAFPSNPIVVNFKAFLSTSPSDEVLPRETYKVSNEDPLTKILEKMSLMDKRIENIEQMISNLSTAGISISKDENKVKDVAVVEAKSKVKDVAFVEAKSKDKDEEVVRKEEPTVKNITPSFQPPSLFSGLLSSQQKPDQTTTTTTNLFAESMKRLDAPLGQPLTFGSNLNFSFSMPKTKDPEPEAKAVTESKVEGEAEGEDEDGDVSHNEELPIENTCDMEPIVIKTGEEDEDKLFENRCKLFRFRDKEYKERGLGSIKVLKHKETGKGRLIMRREAIGLVCLNCWDCKNIQRARDTQIKWTGVDASDGEPEATVFLVKFKTPELADTFMTHMNSLFNEQATPIADVSTNSINVTSVTPTPLNFTTQNKTAAEPNVTPVKANAESPITFPTKTNTPAFEFKFNQNQNPVQNSPPSYQPSLFSGFMSSQPKTEPITTNLFAESMKRLNMPTGAPLTFGNNFSFNFSMPNSDSKFAEPETKTETEADGDEEGGEVSHNEELPIENTCDMEPIVIKTGEEDEDKLFENRCKLFRFRDKEYKERGLGSIKVLKHKVTGKGRLIMRREAIGLVCLNCWDCNNIQRVRDTQVKWTGVDASDGEAEATIFLVKFKTPELTDTFMTHMNSLFNEQAASGADVSSNSSDKPDVELVDPQLDQNLVDRARMLQLPDLFYHKLKNQEPCSGCNGCEKDD